MPTLEGQTIWIQQTGTVSFVSFLQTQQENSNTKAANSYPKEAAL